MTTTQSQVKRGIAAAAKFHEENTGMPYTPFKLKEDGAFRVVRLLQDETQWVSLFMHKEWGVKIPSTRCLSQGSNEPDMENCVMCAHGIGRQLRTYIPVRVRQDENEKRVCIIDYGRDHLIEVVNCLEEYVAKPGEDTTEKVASITELDIKIKRIGKDTNTNYKWIPSGQNRHPLNEAELSLEVPDMDALIVEPTEARLSMLISKFTSTGKDEAKEEEQPERSRSPF